MLIHNHFLREFDDFLDDPTQNKKCNFGACREADTLTFYLPLPLSISRSYFLSLQGVSQTSTTAWAGHGERETSLALLGKGGALIQGSLWSFYMDLFQDIAMRWRTPTHWPPLAWWPRRWPGCRSSPAPPTWLWSTPTLGAQPILTVGSTCKVTSSLTLTIGKNKYCFV